MVLLLLGIYWSDIARLKAGGYSLPFYVQELAFMTPHGNLGASDPESPFQVPI